MHRSTAVCVALILVFSGWGPGTAAAKARTYLCVYERHPVSLMGQNIMKPSGRGLLLIRTFMDEVIHNETGNRITLVKRKPVNDSLVETSPPAESLTGSKAADTDPE